MLGTTMRIQGGYFPTDLTEKFVLIPVNLTTNATKEHYEMRQPYLGLTCYVTDEHCHESHQSAHARHQLPIVLVEASRI
jgi:hypothetical protein